MKVYISGRITDYSGYLDHFSSAALYVEAMGHEAFDPCKIEIGKDDPSYEDYMKADILQLLTCDAIYMLGGWEKSVGARCEHMVAAMCGLEIFYEKSKTVSNVVLS